MVLTLKQAADLLSVSTETARRLAVGGALPGAFRVGRNWRVSEAAFRAWLEAW